MTSSPINYQPRVVVHAVTFLFLHDARTTNNQMNKSKEQMSACFELSNESQKTTTTNFKLNMNK